MNEPPACTLFPIISTTHIPIGLWVVEMLGNYVQEGNTSLEFIEDRVHYLRLIFMGSIMLLIMRFSPGGILPEKNKEL